MLSRLQGRLPDWVKLPSSAAMPFGCFEAVLSDPKNAALAEQVQRLEDQKNSVEQELAQLRQSIKSQLQCPTELRQQLQEACTQAGK